MTPITKEHLLSNGYELHDDGIIVYPESTPDISIYLGDKNGYTELVLEVCGMDFKRIKYVEQITEMENVFKYLMG